MVKSFLGHAYYYRDNKAYHHGTLLVNSEMDKLTYYLNPSIKKIQSKGVESVRSRVCNISEYYSYINLGILTDALISSFKEFYTKLKEVNNYEDDNTDITLLYQKYASWDWRYGKIPNFDISFSERFNLGEVELKFEFKSGIIDNFMIYSDTMDADMFNNLRKNLVGQKYQRECIIKQI